MQQERLAASIENTLNQLSLKETELLDKERNLKIEKDVVAQLYRQWVINGNRVQLTLGELKLWRQQAEAIERSPSHLQTIDNIIKTIEAGMTKENIVLPTCEVELVVYRTMLRDRTKFNQLAFSLIAEQNQASQHSEQQYNFDDES